MTYSISCIINGTTNQLLAGKNIGSPYQLVTQSDSQFHFEQGATGPHSPEYKIAIIDFSSTPPLEALPYNNVILSGNYFYDWLIYYYEKGQFIRILEKSEIPIDNNIPIGISTSQSINDNLWWRIVNGKLTLSPFDTNDDSSYKFYISTYSNLLTNSYNVLASSTSVINENMVLDFTTYPNIKVTTNRSCSPPSIQSYKGHKISPSKYLFAENQTVIDIALESGNLTPNFNILKSFNNNHSHIVKFKNTYLYISKDKQISAETLSNINRINTKNGYLNMYPLHNVINCNSNTCNL